MPPLRGEMGMWGGKLPGRVSVSDQNTLHEVLGSRRRQKTGVCGGTRSFRLQQKSAVDFSALLPGNVSMAPGLYQAIAASVLLLHAAYIAWVIFGTFFTRGRPRLAALHVVTLVYGVIIEIFGFWCPLTVLENWLEVRGGVSAYRGPFLLHYLDAAVYPNIPPNLLIAGTVAVCVLNLWIYARRIRVRHSLG